MNFDRFKCVMFACLSSRFSNLDKVFTESSGGPESLLHFVRCPPSGFEFYLTHRKTDIEVQQLDFKNIKISHFLTKVKPKLILNLFIF